jgi:hypothetical protein
MQTNEVQEERNHLRSLLVSNYAEFKSIVLGDMLKTIPVQASIASLIEDYLRQRYAEQYVPESSGGE